ncbi:MazG nucleotide pyrophosphohydrolase domain-containing protein [Blautia sp. XA-2221]|uniref:MazG nucleotide pyrophosphohydrolase domain-containing protein n=1 Tax=Blautia sp. XA-2221 TaxID=2903961 RepID=UPI00237821F7|nr:MazG nucleotide pyrophosphohydrolase domain-containing protein [Blautia sp. XA-2221]
MQNFDEFMEVVKKIRKNCPWDKVQTHESLKPYLISETNELLEGIDRLETQNDSENLCEELGDVLFQVALHSVIAQEEGLFTIEDVIDGISSKMQFRHPGIFAPEDETMTSLSWDELKEIEKSRKTEKL